MDVWSNVEGSDRTAVLGFSNFAENLMFGITDDKLLHHRRKKTWAVCAYLNEVQDSTFIVHELLLSNPYGVKFTSGKEHLYTKPFVRSTLREFGLSGFPFFYVLSAPVSSAAKVRIHHFQHVKACNCTTCRCFRLNAFVAGRYPFCGIWSNRGP